MHRQKADESYQLGEKNELTPVGAYLNIERIIHIAKQNNVRFIHPGYGFLSENSEFARKVEKEDILFVGPTYDVIAKLGDKTAARKIVPIVPGTDGPVLNEKQIESFVDSFGLPIIIKAAMGGGGRGMRIVRTKNDIKDAYNRAKSEAKTSFGDDTIFVERFLDKPRHIEVQILADNYGNVIHLFERDCSVQRRHQKVVEIAPAKNLSDKTRSNLFGDAIKIAKYVNYRNAGTVEFLVDPNTDQHYFIEINPRIQEITGIDIVAAQIQIAAGATLEELGLSQDKIITRGFAIQCRVTTEDPENGFQPDAGKIDVYRTPGGKGVRLDGGMGFSGANITPYYDSLLVKVTCLGNTFEIARRKILRALTEFRIRGVKTNITFLQKLVTNTVFVNEICWTTMIDDLPELLKVLISKNRAQKSLTYISDVVVNGSSIKGQVGKSELISPIVIQPFLDENGQEVVTSQPCNKGWRNILLEKGPEEFAKLIRSHSKALITDTTWRDAHQSLLATRVRTIDICKIAPHTSYCMKNAFSLEMWGGATFDVSLRFLYECPWDRLKKLRALVPNIPFQMLLRGANAVGYTSYPDNVIYEFCKKARECGVDVFRVFDSLNYVENMKLGIDAVRKANGVIEATICYTGDVSDPKRKKHDLEYYLNLTKELVDCKIHILGIKDMAGLLKPKAAELLISKIREKFPGLPIHVHTHDTAGTGVASMLSAIEAGADIVDAAIDSMSGLTSQPSLGAIVEATRKTSYEIEIKQIDIEFINNYWEQLRLLYSCFDPGVKSGDSGVYEHEMPGGQYTNLLFQSKSLGLGTQWNAIKKAYKEANLVCGDIVKVTPSSKVVGDLAQFMVSNHLKTYQEVIEKAGSLSFPKSVIEFFQGYLGQPYGGFNEELREKIIGNRPKINQRPGIDLEAVDFDKLYKDLTLKYGPHINEYDAISAALYPVVFDEYQTNFSNYGDVSIIPTEYFLNPPKIGEEFSIEIERGKTLIIKLLAVGPFNEENGKRDVYYLLNGESRVITVTDKNSNSSQKKVERKRADKNNINEIGAPMTGVVVEIDIEGNILIKSLDNMHVEAGETLCVLSAMKMETSVSAPFTGIVKQVLVNQGDNVGAGDLIVIIEKSKK